MVAVLAALVVVAAGLHRALAPPRDVYRIELSRSPLELARWFAERYPDYFLGVEREHYDEWEETLSPPERALARSVAHELVRRWVATQSATEGDTTRQAEEHVAFLRTLMTSQRILHGDLDHLAAWAPDDAFELGTLSRLVRGYSNCDGYNHLLALLLAERRPVEIVGADSGHRLVRVDDQGLGGPLFADAWSDLPVFFLDPQRRDREARGVPSWTRMARLGLPPGAGANEGGILPRHEYADASVKLTVTSTLRRELPDWPDDLPADIDTLSPREPMVAVPGAFRDYLQARVEHVFGDPQRARTGYEGVLDLHCADPPHEHPVTCRASSRLLESLATASADAARR